LPIKAVHPVAHPNASENSHGSRKAVVWATRISVAVRTSHLSCGKAGNTQKFTPVGAVQVISARNNSPLHAQQSDHNYFFAILVVVFCKIPGSHID
jgi:hypothetical protein